MVGSGFANLEFMVVDVKLRCKWSKNVCKEGEETFVAKKEVVRGLWETLLVLRRTFWLVIEAALIRPVSSVLLCLLGRLFLMREFVLILRAERARDHYARLKHERD